MVPEERVTVTIEGLLTVTEPVPNTEEDFLRVSGQSNAKDVAAAIAHAIYDRRRVVVRAVGAAAVNQSIKAMIIARGFVATQGLDLVCRPGFVTVPGRDGGDISAIILIITAS